MAWRALKKMRRNPEQLFDVTIQPLLFTAMFACIFGGAISGSVQELPAAASSPGIVAPDRAHHVHGHRRAAARGHGQGRLRPVQGAADRPDRAAGRSDGRRPGALPDRRRPDVRHRASLIGYRPGGGVLGVLGAILLAVFTGWSLAWIFTWFGTVARSAQARAGDLDDGPVPADVPVQRVRPGQDAAGLPADVRRTSTRSRTWSPPSATWPTTAVISGQVGWALLGWPGRDRGLRAALGAQLQAAHVAGRRAAGSAGSCSTARRASSSRSAGCAAVVVGPQRRAGPAPLPRRAAPAAPSASVGNDPVVGERLASASSRESHRGAAVARRSSARLPSATSTMPSDGIVEMRRSPGRAQRPHRPGIGRNSSAPRAASGPAA